ncbi:hypothetical protein [Agrobacterium vitis]|nr:hypothetical protein [Agrobacterium vitis]
MVPEIDSDRGIYAVWGEGDYGFRLQGCRCIESWHRPVIEWGF